MVAKANTLLFISFIIVETEAKEQKE